MDGLGWDWKSLYALILRAPLCGANKHIVGMFTGSFILYTFSVGIFCNCPLYLYLSNFVYLYYLHFVMSNWKKHLQAVAWATPRLLGVLGFVQHWNTEIIVKNCHCSPKISLKLAIDTTYSFSCSWLKLQKNLDFVYLSSQRNLDFGFQGMVELWAES